jgi:hypothetical protein
MMSLKCDPAWKIMDDLGFPRTPDRLLKFCGTHVWLLEVFKTRTSTCGSYNLGGSATASPVASRVDEPCPVHLFPPSSARHGRRGRPID